MLTKFNLPKELKEVLDKVSVKIPESRSEILDMALGGDPKIDIFEVAYDVPGKGRVVEATVTRCKNGASVNYTEAYMRRRDPNCMVICDDKGTDKTKYKDKFGSNFAPVRKETFEWLSQQEELVIMPFMAGGKKFGYPTLLVSPVNACFFVGGLADLQEFVPVEELPENCTPRAVLYLAPTFRHTHFEGKQVVAHNRLDNMHEIFSYNLYPGPSAKKGAYSILLNIGESENWTTLHASTVEAKTPYENKFIIMHEGASGGGKSEMLQSIHRENDGRIKLCENINTKEKSYIELKETCELYPITDDMALAHPNYQNPGGKLKVTDAEAGWFLRVDHLTEYGMEPNLERLTIHPQEPLIFLNIDGKPHSTALLWEHTMDTPEKPCPNPRVIMPRRFVPNTEDKPVEADIRSFGVRTPPTTKEKPNYGIVGFMHVLPTAIAWLWRLVAPRGHSNPSIVGTGGLTSEGVGSYWPFCTGKMVTQANLLFDLMKSTPGTRYKLIPNQYIGAYHVGFKPEWIAREYLARRGNVLYKMSELEESRCPLLGYSLKSLKIEGQVIPKWLLSVYEQPEVGIEAYDKGAAILTEFFKKELERFMTSDLQPECKKIIDICLSNGTLQDYIDSIPGSEKHFDI